MKCIYDKYNFTGSSLYLSHTSVNYWVDLKVLSLSTSNLILILDNSFMFLFQPIQPGLMEKRTKTSAILLLLDSATRTDANIQPLGRDEETANVC